MASPIPALAPVTTATLPFHLSIDNTILTTLLETACPNKMINSLFRSTQSQLFTQQSSKHFKTTIGSGKLRLYSARTGRGKCFDTRDQVDLGFTNDDLSYIKIQGFACFYR